jgi:tape measure domain-containing protein
MAGDLETRIVIGGDAAGAEKASQQTLDSLERVRESVSKPLGKIEAFEKATDSLDAMQAALDEARRRLVYFREMANISGEAGAKAFAADIKATEREIDKLNISIGKQNSSLNKLSSELNKAGVDTRDLANEKARLSGAVLKAEKGIIDLKGRLIEERAAAKEAADRTREAGNAAEKAGQQSDKGSVGVENLVRGMKALAAAAVVREFVQANASMEAMTKSLELVTGSSEAAAREMEFVRGQAARLGLDINSAANSYLQLSASAKGTVLEGQATRDIWSAVAESMARLGKTSAETDGALLAISQMMSKGVVSAEELRGQLGERLPGAFQVAAKAMGVSTQELGKMLEQGQILASDFLPKFSAELRKVGGDGGEVSTYNANLSRLWSSLKNGAVAINEVIPLFDAISWSIGALAKGINTAATGWSLLAKRLYGDKPALDETAKSATGAANAVDQVGKSAEGAASKSAKLDGVIKDLEKNLKTLGLDKADLDAQAGYLEARYIEAFKSIARSSASSSEMIFQSLLMAVDKVSGNEGLNKLRYALDDTFRKGRISAEQFEILMEAIFSKMEGLWASMEDGIKKTKQLEEAYKTLGIQSQTALDGLVARNKDALDIITKSGASLQVQNTAWAKYAESAIAANGGVADSLIQSEAAQRGFKIEVDDSGKAVLRLKSVVDDLGKSLTYAGAAMSRLPADINGGIGTMTERMAEWGRQIQAIGDGMAFHVNALRKEFAALGPAAEDTFNTMLTGARDVFGPGGLLTTGPASPLAQMRDRMDKVNASTARWIDTLNASGVTLADVEGAMRFLNASTLDGYTNMEALGQERLEPLLNALDQARQRLRDMRAEAADTLANLRDELDDLNANYDDIERRRAKQREEDLQAQLVAAKSAGDQKSVADLSEALRLLKQINAARIEEAAQREKAARAPSTSTTTATSSSSSGGVGASQASSSNTGGITIVVQGDALDVDGLAAKLQPALQRAERLRS